MVRDPILDPYVSGSVYYHGLECPNVKGLPTYLLSTSVVVSPRGTSVT